MSIREQLNKLKDYYKLNNPHDLNGLCPPATDKDIKELEKKLSGVMRLPKGYVEFLKIHNGCDSRRVAPSAYFSIDGWDPLAIRHVISTWEVHDRLLEEGDFDDNKSRASPGVKGMWWNPKWVPILANGAGDNLCIDFDPAPGGKIGQIIDFDHAHDFRTKVADSFEEWFEMAVAAHIKEAEEYKAKQEEEKNKPKSRLPAWLSWIAS